MKQGFLFIYIAKFEAIRSEKYNKNGYFKIKQSLTLPVVAY